MWREKLLCQESVFNTQIYRFNRSRKISELLKIRDWHPESQKHPWKRCWILSETFWATFQLPAMKRMGKTRKMMKIQCCASWAKTTNPAGWWEQSSIWYTTTCRYFSRSRWDLTNWDNWDWGMQPTTSMRQIRRMSKQNWIFQPSLSLKWTNLQLHQHKQHVESLWRLLILFPEYRICHKRRLDQEVVIWGLAPGNHRQTKSSGLSHPTRCPICYQSTNGSPLNLNAFSPAHFYPNQSQDTNWIWTKKCWWLGCCSCNRQAACDFWWDICWKCNSCSYFVTCQLRLDFTDQYMRRDNLSGHMQGLYAPCNRSSCRIWLSDNHWTGYRITWYCHGRIENLKLRLNLWT